jgi:hypothetical protein
MSPEALQQHADLMEITICASGVNIFSYRALQLVSGAVGAILGMGPELREVVENDSALLEMTKLYASELLLWIPDPIKLAVMLGSDGALAWTMAQTRKAKSLKQRSDMRTPALNTRRPDNILSDDPEEDLRSKFLTVASSTPGEEEE